VATLIDKTPKVKAISKHVISSFFVKMNPAEKILKLITSSVKYSKKIPSLPSSLSQRGHLCFRDAVN